MLAAEAFDPGGAMGYLDTATYGLPPRATISALEDALRAWQEREGWHRWEEDGEACRALFASLVGTRPEHVSLQPALSAAAGIVAASLPAVAGDNVVCYERDFHSVLFPFLALEARGIELRLRPLDELAEAVDERTALVAVSSVQSADGRVADLAALGSTGARVFVDGTQSVGALPVPLESVDYLGVAAYKWLLCPRGLDFLYVRPERLPEIEPWLSGWKASRSPYDRYYGPPRELTDDARRLDTSLAWFLAAGSRPSLELLARIGVEEIARHDLALARRFCDGLGIPETGSAIVQVEVPDAEAVLARLESAGVRAAGRDGAVRFSFHLYNDEADVDRALAVLGGADPPASERSADRVRPHARPASPPA
jgi:selenocysteine lyase/cysteine desulfurase